MTLGAGDRIETTLVDLDFNPALPPVAMLTLRVTCTNRDQAARLKLPGEFGASTMISPPDSCRG